MSFSRGQTVALRAIREQRPVVHCLTNAVTIGRVADALAALGARPIMASAEEEVREIVDRADALLLNLGTPDAARWRAANLAGARAATRGLPIVFDPVGCGVSAWRTDAARRLVQETKPSIVRGNAAEIASLAGIAAEGVTLRGVTSEGETSIVNLAERASRRLGRVVVATGPTTAISDGTQTEEVAAPPSILAHLVGAGDVLSALIAAVAATQPSKSFESALAGVEIFQEAALQTAESARRPGTFWVRFINQLDSLATYATESARREGETQPV